MPRSQFPEWARDACIAAVVIVAALVPAPGPGPRPGHPMPPDHGLLSAFEVLAVVVPVALVFVRRRLPLPVLAAGVVLFCVATIGALPAMGLGVVAIVAAFTVADRTNRLVGLLAGGIGAGIVAVLSITISEFGVVEPRVFQIAAAIAVAAALGDSSRSRREYVRAAMDRAERAERTREAEAQRRVAEERLRIARDLHDTVAHRISVISLNAGVASTALEARPEKAREALATIRGAARGVLSDIGDLLRYLRADDAPVAGPPQPGLADLEHLLARMTAAGLHVEVSTTGDLARAEGAVDLVAYRVIQEGLTNAHKHGARGVATLTLEIGDDQMLIRITNPVATHERNEPESPPGGLGLTGIRERAASVHGSVEAGPADQTFALTVRLPLQGTEHR